MLRRSVMRIALMQIDVTVVAHDANGAANTIDIFSAFAAPFRVNSHGGADTINLVGNVVGSFVTLDGGAGLDDITVNSDTAGVATAHFDTTQDLSSLAIFEGSTQKDAAWAYVQFHLGLPDEQVKIYVQTDLFPGLQTTYTDPAFQEPDPYFGGQQARAFFTEVAKDIPTAGVYSMDYQQMNSLLTPEIQKFALGQQSAKDALTNAANAIRDKTGRK